MSKNKPIQFNLKSIRTDEFATVLDTPIIEEKTRIRTGLGMVGNKELSVLTIAFRAIFESNEHPFIILQVSCQYEIHPEDFSNFPMKSEEIITLPKDFILHLAFLTVGTARGILHAKVENTPFQKFLIPVMDVSGMVTGEIPLSKSLDLK